MKKYIYRNILLIILIVFIISGLFFIVNNFISDKDKIMKVKVGMMPIADCLQLFVANEKGFFKEEDLEVELLPMSGGAVIAPAVASGNLDIGWSNTVSIIIAHEKGFDFQFLIPGAFRDSSKGIIVHQLLVPKDSDIKEPKDLEGKIIAINTLGNINELVIKAWANKHEVNIEKITLVELPFPQMEVALKNKQIDGAIVIEPFVTLSLSHDVAKPLDNSPFDAVSERLMIASWFAKKSWIDKNSKKAKSFINAINKANTYIIENPKEMPDILVKHTKLTEDLANKISLPSFERVVKKSDIQVMINSSYELGFITRPFDVTEIVTKDVLLK